MNRNELGRFIQTDTVKYHKGYKVVYMPSHPRARQNGYVYEHILVAEDKMKRPLREGEIVHHIDGNKLNNRPDNLMVFPSQSEHNKHHWKTRSTRYELPDGSQKSIKELSDMTGQHYSMTYQRIKKLGWTAEEVLNNKRNVMRNTHEPV